MFDHSTGFCRCCASKFCCFIKSFKPVRLDFPLFQKYISLIYEELKKEQTGVKNMKPLKNLNNVIHSEVIEVSVVIHKSSIYVDAGNSQHFHMVILLQISVPIHHK